MVQQSSSLIIQQKFPTQEDTPEKQMEISIFESQITAKNF